MIKKWKKRRKHDFSKTLKILFCFFLAREERKANEEFWKERNRKKTWIVKIVKNVDRQHPRNFNSNYYSQFRKCGFNVSSPRVNGGL